MLTKKQKRSIEQVYEVFHEFYDKVQAISSFTKISEDCNIACKLTQIYIECHEADGTPCGEVSSYDLDESEKGA